jgi:hypothetical protein
MKNCPGEKIVDTTRKLEVLLNNFKRKGISAFKDLQTKDQKALINWSEKITREYTNLVDNDLSNVKDITALPHPKDDIKIALKIILPVYISGGPPRMIKRLKLAYQELGSFQQINPGDKKTILNPTAIKDADSSTKISDCLATYDRYLEIAISERKILFQEIENYIEDVKYLHRN